MIRYNRQGIEQAKKEIKKIKLNIGCGTDIKEGYTNIDYIKFKGVNFVLDLDKNELPYLDNSVSEIIAFNILEHLTNPLFMLKECCRILKPDGIIKINVPHFTYSLYYADITHKTHFSYFTFKWLELNAWGIEGINFKIKKLKFDFLKGKMFWDYLIQPIANMFPNFYEYTPLKIFQCKDIYCELIKKGEK